jgi:NADPH:quinone reductase-like Zn-dependent oxidoreductase
MVAKIPDDLSFEEAATIPLCFLTAVIAIFGSLGVPEEYSLASPPKLLVNGAGSAIGFYAAQLAKLAGLEVYVLKPSRLMLMLTLYHLAVVSLYNRPSPETSFMRVASRQSI